MKKSSFVALVLGSVGGILTAIGMCMCLLPEWGVFSLGWKIGIAGLAVLLATLFIWRKMEHKESIRFSFKNIMIVLLGIAGALLLGVGMALSMVWGNLIWGIAVGIVGILALIALIPLVMGVH